jgi:hypothetical protein
MKPSSETLTKAGVKKVAEAVAKGVPVSTCASLVGVLPGTLKRWLAHGQVMAAEMELKGEFPPGSQKHDWLCYDLSRAVAEAKTKAVMRYIKKINAAANHSWIPASWLLQRVCPEEFGAKGAMIETEMKGPKGGGEVSQMKVSVYIPDNGRDPA